MGDGYVNIMLPEEAELFILVKLLDRHMVCHKAVLEENLAKGKPRSDWKAIFKAVDELNSKGVFCTKRKHYGVHYCLNPRKLDEIREYITNLRKKLNR